MRLTFLLADSAQQVNGKLYILGGGWSVTGPEPALSAITGILHVPWDDSNKPHRLAFDLLESDGPPLLVPTPMGLQPFHIEIGFEVGRPPGVAAGTEFNVPFALNLGPLPFEPGKRYEWRPSINGNEIANARLAFSVRARGANPG